MPTIKEILTNDVKEAMRSGDRLRRDTLRLVLAAIKQAEVDQQTTLDDQELLSLLQKEAKKRLESIHDYTAAGNPAAAAAEQAELGVIEAYLPAQATEGEIATRAQVIITELGLSGPKAIGAVMKEMMAEFQGRADGKLVNQIVRRQLGN